MGLAKTTSIVFLLCIAANASAERLVAEFSGNDNKVTGEFEVEGPWLLDWLISGDYAHGAGIEIDLIDAVFLNPIGTVLQARRPNSGTKMFASGGRFRFRVSATLINWRLRVSVISQKQADAMIQIKPEK